MKNISEGTTNQKVAKVTAQPTAKSYKQANFEQQFQSMGRQLLSPELSALIEYLTITSEWVSELPTRPGNDQTWVRSKYLYDHTW